jgi:GNAT superfamily N-acetyltransferase
MKMSPLRLRPLNPDRDFPAIAPLLSSQEDTPTSPSAARADYEKHQDSIIRLRIAEDDRGELLGFTWVYPEKAQTGLVSFYLVVKPERRGQGAGRLLYEDLIQAIATTPARRLRTTLPDACQEGRLFAERRGFREIRHTIGMELDLASFEDRPYDAILARLQEQGFRFTSMAELGDTPEAQRRLFALNDSAVLHTLGQNAEHAWASFEDFQKSVCGAEWYKPDGQIVAIDTASGAWAAMSAITRMAGQEHAYNLFTGVDLPYRRRQLGQAVKLLALRYARNMLNVKIVRTHHNTKNLPMLAIDRKFGYQELPGFFLMEKEL